MEAERWQRVRSLFAAALEREPAEWPAWLAAACGDDPALREEVQSLLASHRAGGVLPEIPWAGADEESSSDPLVGQRLGPYEVLQRLGGGGMGVVYLAVRVDGQFRKRVALKVLKPGMDSEEILRRFRTEQQILAALDHPNIARLLDGGTTDRGLPYFVMEYVEGRPILEYCEQARLSLSGRLQLFRTVCAAVQFAHQNLVVHRDLKPGNILVDVGGTPKLLDFGIAKLLNPELSGQALAWTALGVQPLTLDYASPEQVRGGHITTASDVYSLGVMLYELLTGRHPHRGDGCTAEQMARRITEQEPERPSSAAGEHWRPADRTRDGIKARGGRRRMSRHLAGDLDTIVLTALRKEPHHRYGSVERLSDDIRRFLEGLPVMARKSTLRYRAGKFVGRHPLGVGAAATAAVALLLFGVGMGALALRLARERERAEQVTAFLTELFEVSDPSHATGRTITARELLDAGARRIGTDLANEPEVQSDLMETIGMIYRRLGLQERALPLVERALARRQQLFGNDHPKVAQSLNDLALLHEDKGEYRLAESLYRRALSLRRRHFGPQHPEVAQSLSDVAAALWAQGNYAAAERGFRESLAMRRSLFGERHLDVAKSLNNVGVVLWSSGRPAEAEPFLRRALAVRRELLGERHVEVADGLANLALVAQAQGHLAEAERLQRAALALRRELLDPGHPRLADSLNNLGFVLQAVGRHREADPLHREALAIRQRRLGGRHPDVAQSLHNLGVVAWGLGDYRSAENHHRAALAIRRDVFGDRNHNVADSLDEIAAALQGQGQLASAEALLRQALAIRQRVLGPGHPDTATTLTALADVLVAKGDLAAAEKLAREAVYRLVAKQPRSTWEVAWAESVLGGCLARRGHFAEAEPLLAGGYATLRASFGDQASLTRDARLRLIDLDRVRNRPDRAPAYAAARE